MISIRSVSPTLSKKAKTFIHIPSFSFDMFITHKSPFIKINGKQNKTLMDINRASNSCI